MTIIASVISVLSLLCIVGNWTVVFLWWIKKKPGSLVPVIGGLLGLIAVLIFDVPKYYAIVPLIVDPGSIPMVVAWLWSRSHPKSM